MFEKAFKYIVLGLLCIVVIQGFFKTPDGIMPEEEAYRLKIHDLNQELTELKKIDYEKEELINQFITKYDSIKGSSVNDTSTINELGGFFREYVNNRR